MLTVLSQPNFVSLVGFCAQGDKRLLLIQAFKGGAWAQRHKLDGQMLIEEENTMQQRSIQHAKRYLGTRCYFSCQCTPYAGNRWLNRQSSRMDILAPLY
ncbi:uncharacterized protein LOC125545293 isoform X4 [Triticum urartu]|uniref:uncharacterized protein LOC125545293 isoform X4 n=1 Tax=Triticum urartu TaxID=4572 RepID=UPI002043A7D8|nr:uncharacterized protein LOC125545293 isoform X4 [Triticum urartu]